MRQAIRGWVIVVTLVATTAWAGAQAPPPPSPGPGWVLQDGGWLPPGHPGIREVCPGAQPSPTFVPCENFPPAPPVRLGQVVARDGRQVLVIGVSLASTGEQVYTGQVVGQTPVQVVAWVEGR